MPSRSAWKRVTRTVRFDEFGDSWRGSYIEVTCLSYLGRSQYVDDRAKLAADDNATDSDFAGYIVNLVKDNFVAGELFGEPAKADDLDNAPVEVINLLLDAILGVIADPKASETSTETSLTNVPTSEQPS